MGAMALAVAAVAIIACNKEKEAKSSQDAYEKVTVSKEDDMNAYLKQFKEKMQSAEKGDETLSLEEARWHLEAVLNYTYGEAGNPITNMQLDTFYYELPTNGEEVPLSRLNDAFNSLSIDVEKAFAACVLPDKSILAIQTRFENESKDGEVMIRTIMETRSQDSEFNEFQFGPTDYWYEDHLCGKCGPYVGQCIDIGAVQVLQSKINLRIPQRACEGYYYYSDIEQIDVDDLYIMRYLEDTLSPCGYRVHFYGDLKELFPLCLSPDDLNYYLEEAMKLINELKPQGKVIINMTNQYYDLVPACPTYFGYHHYTLYYGVFHCSGPID